ATCAAPQYAFSPRNSLLQKRYYEGFSVAELMAKSSAGLVTARDSLTLDTDKIELWRRVQDFVTPFHRSRPGRNIGWARMYAIGGWNGPSRMWGKTWTKNL